MSTPLSEKTIAFLVATEGIEQIELTRPWQEAQDAGATCHLVSTESGEVQAFEHLTAADTFSVDRVVGDVDVQDYDALVLPGGVANPDALRLDGDAVSFVKAFAEVGKPIAAICHAPWVLAEADVLGGRTVTSWPSLRTDLTNAGAKWVDEEVVVCDRGRGRLVTSRNPDDLDAFTKAMVDVIAS